MRLKERAFYKNSGVLQGPREMHLAALRFPYTSRKILMLGPVDSRHCVQLSLLIFEISDPSLEKNAIYSLRCDSPLHSDCRAVVGHLIGVLVWSSYCRSLYSTRRFDLSTLGFFWKYHGYSQHRDIRLQESVRPPGSQ